MERSTIFAGFGGQGLLFAGQVVARAAMADGLGTLWIPSYGPEMRGGTASCTVIVGDGPIGSPVVDRYDAAVVLNPPSMARYEPLVAEGGILVFNTSLIEAEPSRADIDLLPVRCTALAREAGDDRLVSIVALGALLARRPLVSIEGAEAALAEMLATKRADLLDANRTALQAGLTAGGEFAAAR